MKLLLIILLGLLGCVLGAFLAAFAYHEVALLVGASNAEGATAMTAAYLFAPLGAIAGIVAGVMLARKLGRNLKPTGAWPAVVFAGLVLAAGVGGYSYLVGDETYAWYEDRPEIHFEIRLPAGLAAPSQNDLRGNLHHYVASKPVRWNEPAIRRDGDRIILSGFARVFRKTDNRLIDYWLDSDRGRKRFFLGLPKEPSPTDGFGDWIRVHRITDPQGATRNPDQPGDDYYIRLRVVMTETE